MGGFDDHVAIIGDWMPPRPSPRSLFSSLTNNEAFVRSFSNSISENKSGSRFPGPEENAAASKNAYQEAVNSNALLTGPNTTSRGGLMERRAAIAGFSAPSLNTESIRNCDLSKEQQVSSPYLTIPAGLSPTTLLDSPVFLTNSLVQPSPTTGKLEFGPSGSNRNYTFMKDDYNKCKENTFEDTSSFAFKPIVESRSAPSFYVKNKVHASGSFPSFGVSIDSDTSFLSVEPPEFQTSNSHTDKKRDIDLSPDQTYQSLSLVENNSSPVDEPHKDDGDKKTIDEQADDGYNWRKYGQKQVKGSEFPRSYYKCTYPNCPVKKKVERSHEGHITEIIYKGAHNHPKPSPGHKPSSLGPSNGPGDMLPESDQPGTGANGDLVCHENGSRYESGTPLDGSCTFSNDEGEDDDRVTHGSVSMGCDGEGDESESKRRRIETYASEISGATRAIREPRVVVQTTSEVDILDDGYRWRKYGQKVVKGNPNPRSYYKCTSPGCNVRKHVERASHDLKSVITTYEGKHNHDVPAARNSSHVNSGGGNTQTPAASHTQRAEPSRIHSSAGRFDRPSLGSFGLPAGRPQQFGPGPGFGFGLNQQSLANLGLVGLGYNNQGNLPVMPVHPYLGYQNRHMSDSVLPKAEPKLEPATDFDFYSSDGLAAYQQLMSRMPLGPQI